MKPEAPLSLAQAVTSAACPEMCLRMSSKMKTEKNELELLDQANLHVRQVE